MFDKMVFGAIKAQMGATVPLAKHLGIALDEVAAGTATATLPAHEHNANHIGSQHAGALFTLADTASGAAVAGIFGAQVLKLRVVVKTAQVAFVKTARGPIVARATASGDASTFVRDLAAGPVEIPVEVALVNADNVPVAAMTFTWHVSEAQKR